LYIVTAFSDFAGEPAAANDHLSVKIQSMEEYQGLLNFFCRSFRNPNGLLMDTFFVKWRPAVICVFHFERCMTERPKGIGS